MTQTAPTLTDEMAAALEDVEYAYAAGPSCQKGLVKRCKCWACFFQRRKDALARYRSHPPAPAGVNGPAPLRFRPTTSGANPPAPAEGKPNGQEQRARKAHKGDAPDGRIDSSGIGEPSRAGEDKHYEHRVGESDADQPQYQCDSGSAGVLGARSVSTAVAEGAPAEAVAWVRQHPDGTLTNELLPEWQIEQARRDSGAWIPLGRIASQGARVGLTDQQAESIIEASDGRWFDSEFRIDGPALMAMLRAAHGIGIPPAGDGPSAGTAEGG